MSTIQILTPTEIRNYESPPRFDSFSRKKFFVLPSGLMKEVENLRTSSGKIAFVLQTGYFRAAQRFFLEADSTSPTSLLLPVGYLCRIRFL